MIVEIERMKKEMLEEARAQLQVNQQTIQDNSVSFKERVIASLFVIHWSLRTALQEASSNLSFKKLKKSPREEIKKAKTKR